MRYLAAGDYERSEKTLAYIEDHYPNGKLTDKVRDIRRRINPSAEASTPVPAADSPKPTADPALP